MHLNSGDEKAQRGALNNIRHLYQELGRERLTVELVAHGAGLALLTKKDSKLAGEVARLKSDYGVEFTACSNTMKAMNLTRDDLVGEVDRTVPAMVRLMELQEQGWAYIKP
jgi:intracellular sulfur oxidation DsrE/DsrF family protein